MSLAHRFLPILAAAGVVVAVHQLADAASALTGTDLSVAGSRMRLLATIGTRGPALMTADIFMLWSALALANGRALRALGVLHLLLGGLALVAIPVFVTDAGAVASTIGPRGFLAYRMLVARMVTILLAGGMAGLVAGRQLSTLASRPAAIPAG